MSENGIACLGNNLYSVTYRFTDVNYKNTTDTVHIGVFEQYCNFLNSFDDSIGLQLFIANRNLMSSTKELFLNENVEDKELAQCLKDYNDEMRNRTIGKKSFTQDKCFSLTVSAPDDETAAKAFERLDNDSICEFRQISSKVQRLNEIDRLYLLRDMYRIDDESTISNKGIVKSGIYGKDLVAPFTFSMTRDGLLNFGDVKAATLFISDLPDEIADDFISDICTVDEELFITINIKPQDPTKAIEQTKKRLKMLDLEEYNSHQKQMKSHAVFPKTPRDLQRAMDTAQEFYDDLQSKNEKTFLVNILITVRGDCPATIGEKVAKINAKVNKAGCGLKNFYVAHEDAFNSAIPLGRNDTYVKRTMTTTAIAAMSPFNVTELVQTDGLCYGRNVLSNNNIFINRKRYNNANAFYFGISGSGKSMGAKMEIWEAFFRTKDDILIIDLEDEFTKLVRLLGGQIVEISAGGSELTMNPFDIKKLCCQSYCRTKAFIVRFDINAYKT